MNFIDSINNRYTTKVYCPSQKIPYSKIDELKDILQMSPSSINSQPWRFTFVIEPEQKKKFAEASFFNEQKIKDCYALVVFSRIDNISLFEKWLESSLPQGAVDYYNNFIKTQTEEEIKSWFSRQLYIALGIFLSACATMDIDSSPMEGIEPEKYNTLLEQTDYHALVAVAIGYRHPDDFNQPTKIPKLRRPIEEVITTIQ